MSTELGDCEEYIHRLYHYLDGVLDDERRSDIKRHLDDCPPCLEGFDFEAELRQLIARKCCEEAPDSLRMRIASAIQHEVGGAGLDRPEGGPLAR